MNEIRIIRNGDVDRVLIGVPEGHKHLRICLKLKNGSLLILQEATLANILRAYTTIKTHPVIRAQELEMKTLKSEAIREGFALHQLLETSRKSEDIEKELRTFLERKRSVI